jgi:glycosyltransferase involved in cell wall biosynthesis
MRNFRKANYSAMLSQPISVIKQNWDSSTIPFLTISCITFNHKNFIEEAIEGFLAQETTFKIELLIHDDASTDGTKQIVEYYANKHPDIIFPIIQSSNQFSKGVKIRNAFHYPIANGKYMALCEGDDFWTDPLKLQKQVEFLEANEEYVMCFHRAKIASFDGKSRVNIYDHLENRDYSGLEILKKWTVPTASVVFRTEILNKNPLPSHPDFLFGDIILFLHLAEFGKIHCLKDMMSVYRVHLSGVSMNQSKLSTLNYIKHHIAIQESFDGKYKNKTNAIIANGYKELTKFHLKKFSMLKAIFYMYNYYVYRLK